MKLFALFILLAAIFALVTQTSAAVEDAPRKVKRSPLLGSLLGGSIPAAGSVSVSSGSVGGSLLDLAGSLVNVPDLLVNLVNEIVGLFAGLTKSLQTVTDLKSKLSSAEGETKAQLETALSDAKAALQTSFTQLVLKSKALIDTSLENVKAFQQKYLPLTTDMQSLLNETLSQLKGAIGLLNDAFIKNILDLAEKIPVFEKLSPAVSTFLIRLAEQLSQVAETFKMLPDAAASGNIGAVLDNLKIQLAALGATGKDLNILVSFVNEISAAIAKELWAIATGADALTNSQTELAGQTNELEAIIEKYWNGTSNGITGQLNGSLPQPVVDGSAVAANVVQDPAGLVSNVVGSTLNVGSLPI